MKQLTYSQARQKFADVIKTAFDDNVPVEVIQRNGNRRVIVVNADDYSALEETAYLSRDYANYKNLIEVMDDFKKRKNIIKVDNLEDLLM